MRTDIRDRRADIERWIREDRSKAYMCRQLNCRPSTLETWLHKLDIQYSGNQPGRGRNDSKRKSAVEYAEGTYVKSATLRQKLIEDGHKEAKCEECDHDTWNELPIPLELHHVDGNHYNNDFENLMVLCPTCHYQYDRGMVER